MRGISRAGTLNERGSVGEGARSRPGMSMRRIGVAWLTWAIFVGSAGGLRAQTQVQTLPHTQTEPGVARGVEMLKRAMGSQQVGETALIALAMVKAGVSSDDSALTT